MATPYTQLTSKADFDSYVKAAGGNVILIAFSPGDATSDALVEALHTQLPPSAYSQAGVHDVYCFDAYVLAELATELDVTFVPTLMWFGQGIMDPTCMAPGRCRARRKRQGRRTESHQAHQGRQI